MVDRELLQRFLEEGLSLQEIGSRVGRPAGTVGYWVKRHGLRAVHANRFAPRGGLTQEQLAPLADAGLSLKQIAERLDRSIATVRYWLRRHGLEAERRVRRAGEPAPTPGTILMRDCRRHGRTPHRYESRGYYRCRKCAQSYVADRRRRVKAILVEEAGGRCVRCGYDRCVRALEFHHLDPGGKSFAVSRKGVTRSIAEVRAEASKCVLLCSNCHAEVEAGLAAPPGGLGEGVPI
ncbi:MAG: hypothetical protein QOJ29_954 [Thermoleophilaceae bacterium]|nr:hypothetical protein [Thermoleophilaceae bacterium]